MYLHLGQNTLVTTKSIMGIFDIDNTTLMKSSRNYLSQAEKEGRVVNVSTELPKSFVVCREKDVTKVYISQIAASTLLKRLGSEQWSVVI